MSEPWLGHRDLCSCQWSDYCDCLPGEPVHLGDTEDAEPTCRHTTCCCECCGPDCGCDCNTQDT